MFQSVGNLKDQLSGMLGDEKKEDLTEKDVKRFSMAVRKIETKLVVGDNENENENENIENNNNNNNDEEINDGEKKKKKGGGGGMFGISDFTNDDDLLNDDIDLSKYSNIVKKIEKKIAKNDNEDDEDDNEPNESFVDDDEEEEEKEEKKKKFKIFASVGKLKDQLGQIDNMMIEDDDIEEEGTSSIIEIEEDDENVKNGNSDNIEGDDDVDTENWGLNITSVVKRYISKAKNAKEDEEDMKRFSAAASKIREKLVQQQINDYENEEKERDLEILNVGEDYEGKEGDGGNEVIEEEKVMVKNVLPPVPVNRKIEVVNHDLVNEEDSLFDGDYVEEEEKKRVPPPVPKTRVKDLLKNLPPTDKKETKPPPSRPKENLRPPIPKGGGGKSRPSLRTSINYSREEANRKKREEEIRRRREKEEMILGDGIDVLKKKNEEILKEGVVDEKVKSELNEHNQNIMKHLNDLKDVVSKGEIGELKVEPKNISELQEMLKPRPKAPPKIPSKRSRLNN